MLTELSDPSNWGEELPLEFALSQATEFISDRSGVILSLERSHRMSDLPRLYQYSAAFSPTRVISDVSMPGEVGGGTSFLPARAAVRALGEALERYCQAIYRSRSLVWGTYGEVSRSQPALDLDRLCGLIPPGAPALSENPLSWIDAWDLSRRSRCLVPAQTMFVPYRFGELEVILRGPITSGAAAGTSYGGALLRGIRELIEREAFLLAYLHRHRPPFHDLAEVGDPFLEAVQESLEFCRLELRVLDLTTDLQVPVALAITVDRTGRYPAVNLGAKSARTRTAAVRGAVEEAFHSLAGGRATLAVRVQEVPGIRARPLEVSTLDGRLLYWSAPEAIDDLSFFLEGSAPARPEIVSESPRSVAEELATLISTCRQAGVDLYAVDLTTPDLAPYGFKVVKIVSPQMVPLYLDERERSWFGNRVLDVPRRLGWPEAAARTEDLNPIPHPFL